MKFASKVMALVLFLVGSAHADQLEAQGKALSIIQDSADRLCKDIPFGQTATEAEASGKAKAELNWLIAKFANLEGEGAGIVKNSQSQGILQKDLAQALKTSTDCKLGVFNALHDKLLPPSPPNDPSEFELLERARRAPSLARHEWSECIARCNPPAGGNVEGYASCLRRCGDRPPWGVLPPYRSR
jgi:hypothetical protein